MDLNKIIEIANEAYNRASGVNDDILLAQWDRKAREPRSDDKVDALLTDGLARFICVEILETYEADETNAKQLSIAAAVVQAAAINCLIVAREITKAIK